MCDCEERVINNLVIKGKIQENFSCDVCGEDQSYGFITATLFNRDSEVKICFSCSAALASDEEYIKDLVDEMFMKEMTEDSDIIIVDDFESNESGVINIDELMGNVKINWNEGEYREKLEKMIQLEEADKEDFKKDKVCTKLPDNAQRFLVSVQNETYSDYDEEYILDYLNLFSNPMEVVEKCKKLAVLENMGYVKSDFFRSIYKQARCKSLSRNQIEAVLNADIYRLANIKEGKKFDAEDGEVDEAFFKTKKFLSNILTMIKDGLVLAESKYNNLTLSIISTVVEKQNNLSSKQAVSIFLFVDRNKDNIYRFIKENELPKEIVSQMKGFLEQYSYINRNGR